MSVKKYVPIIVHTTEFQGDKCRFELEPMDRASYLLARSELDKVRDAPKSEQLDATYVVGCRVLEASLVKIDGLTDVANMPVPKETLLNKVFFKQLVTELFGVLIMEANVGKVSSPDSEEKSPGSSSGQVG